LMEVIWHVHASCHLKDLEKVKLPKIGIEWCTV
jgi:hypothetical protein